MILYTLIKKLYQINCEVIVRKGYNFNKKYLYILKINKKTKDIINDLNLKNNIPKNYIIADEDLEKSYLRGLFMACGSINDPKKSRYHLEFIVQNNNYANFLKKILNKYKLNSKIINRNNRYMIYIKEAEKISDFLKLIGASGAVLYYENIRIYRDHKNMINRLNNCEQANIDKVVFTSLKQIEDIKLIKETTSLNVLDEKLKVVAEYRLKYPETSLKELSEIISLETNTKITKSGLYHRFKKITAIANKIKKNVNKS